MALITTAKGVISPIDSDALGGMNHTPTYISGLAFSQLIPTGGGATVFDGPARDWAASKLPDYILDHMVIT